MTDLTDRQREVLGAILAYQLEQGQLPTLRVLSQAVGMHHPSGVLCHLEALAKKGYVRRASGWHSSVQLVGVTWQPFFDAHSTAGITLAKLYREITGAKQVDFLVDKEALG